MSYILGIDTGGTYTDGVIIEAATKKVITKAKALTTKEDLTIGIRNCLNELNFPNMRKIISVSLSTTLATNAIVEGRGCKVGLLLIGEMPDGKMPTDHFSLLKGKFDIRGNLKEELDIEQAKIEIQKMKGNVESIAISGYASVRNPDHELSIKNLVYEILGLPVVCAHQLTSTLGYYQRTVTAVLNAKLIPIISDLLISVRQILDEQAINAPIMTVKGDGSLMPESIALEKPIDTILSGPAASTLGGAFLTEQKEAFILDMGGTTTDIANVEQGRVKIKKDGAKVGSWLTRVQAAEISTFGLGGDSYIKVDNRGEKMTIGPQRVYPLCIAGALYPYLYDELKIFRPYVLYRGELADQDIDCFMIQKIPKNRSFTKGEQEILDLLEKGPHSLYYITKNRKEDTEELNLSLLVNEGILLRISFTPTDLLHVENRYDRWDKKIAQKAADLLAGKMKLPLGKFLQMADEKILDHLCMACLQSAADFDNQDFNYVESDSSMYLIQKALSGEKGLYSSLLTLNKPIVALGAPIGAWIEGISKKLHTTYILPEHAEVANAIGAAIGQIHEEIDVLIMPEKDGDGYIVTLPWAREHYESLKEAMFYAEHYARKKATASMLSTGRQHFEVTESHEDMYMETSPEYEYEPANNLKQIYIGTKMKIVAFEKAPPKKKKK